MLADTLHNCRRVLSLLRSNLRMLGWVWSNGTLQASSLFKPCAPLSELTRCSAAYFLSTLSSWILSIRPTPEINQEKDEKGLKNYSGVAFKSAQRALGGNKIPQTGDALWIAIDWWLCEEQRASKQYYTRTGMTPYSWLGSSMQLRKHPVTWLPCEIEALPIAAAINHFATNIIQSPHTTEVLTDSRSCVQAYKKLKGGEFSTGSRVTTFLLKASHYFFKFATLLGLRLFLLTLQAEPRIL